MFKSSERISWDVLIKLAAVDPVLVEHVRRVVGRLNYRMPSAKELDQIFPEGSANSRDSWQEQFLKSDFVKEMNVANTAAKNPRVEPTSNYYGPWGRRPSINPKVNTGVLVAGVVSSILAKEIRNKVLEGVEDLSTSQEFKVRKPAWIGGLVGAGLGVGGGLHGFRKGLSVPAAFSLATIGHSLGSLAGLPFSKRRLIDIQDRVERKREQQFEKEQEEGMRKVSYSSDLQRSMRLLLASGLVSGLTAGIKNNVLEGVGDLSLQQRREVRYPAWIGRIGGVGLGLGGGLLGLRKGLRPSEIAPLAHLGGSLGTLAGLPFSKQRLTRIQEEQEEQEGEEKMRKAASDMIGKALYRGNGPRMIDALLSVARDRYKSAQAVGEGAGPAPTANTPVTSPIDEQHKQNLNAQELQFSQEEHQLQLEKMRQEIAQKQQAFEMKQMQMAQQQQQQQAAAQQQQEMQQQSMMGAQVPPEQQAAMQAEQYRQNMMVSQGAQPAEGPPAPGPAAAGMGPGAGPGMNSGMGY